MCLIYKKAKSNSADQSITDLLEITLKMWQKALQYYIFTQHMTHAPSTKGLKIYNKIKHDNNITEHNFHPQLPYTIKQMK